MALIGTGAVLGASMRAAMQAAALSNAGQPTEVIQAAVYQAMGEAIIAHLTGVPGVAAVTVPGVTVGAATVLGTLV